MSDFRKMAAEFEAGLPVASTPQEAGTRVRSYLAGVNSALEEAAKVADAQIDEEWPSDDLSRQARGIAALIRALMKESTP